MRTPTMTKSITNPPADLDPAYIGNGMIGLRVKPNPFESWKAAVSGFVMDEPDILMECQGYAPYPLRINFTSSEGSEAQASVREQALDMYTGELTTDMSISLSDNRLDMQVMQFASRSVPCVVCQETKVTPEKSGDLVITGVINGAPHLTLVNNGHRKMSDLMALYTSLGERSKLGVAVLHKFDDGAEVTREKLPEDQAAEQRVFRVKVTAGVPFTIRSTAAMVSDIYHPNPDLEAFRLANWGAYVGFDELRQANRREWERIWQGRPVIEGDPQAEEVLESAVFYLFSSAHKNSRTGIAPFGLSQVLNYYGHVFWDQDSYMMPPLLLMDPKIGRACQEFRYRGLEAAKNKARLFGFEGAMFPWQAAIDGSEANSTPNECGWTQQHITPVVALSFWHYYLATGDEEFAREMAWPVIKAASEWIVSRVIKTERGYEILNVMSADESVPQVDNSSYTNAVAAEVLRVALELAPEYAPSHWREIAENMYIPTRQTPDGEAMRQYEGDDNLKYSNVDIFMMGFPFDLPIDRDLMLRSYRYHVARIDRDFPSMGHTMMSGCAAWAGDRKATGELFRDYYSVLQRGVWGMVSEYRNHDTTCFLTGFGGLLYATMMAFTGLRFGKGDWRKYPACLPEGWKRIVLPRVYIRGKAYRVEAVDGEKAEVTLLD